MKGKRLYRSHKERKVLGILGGVAEYLDLDPAVVRLVYVTLMFVTAVVPMALAYLIGYLIIPAAPLPPPGSDAKE